MKRHSGNILYIDCFSGISGDMFIGAALDLGKEYLDTGILLDELSKIDMDGYEITASKEKRGPVYGTRFYVKTAKEQPSRDFRDIKRLIGNSSLKREVKDLSIKIFAEIARAESVIHSKPQDKVHFHEVGAVDSIVDIVCTSIVIDRLDVGMVYGGRIPLGKGKARSMHGSIPVPAPATLEILKGVPVYGGGFDFEVTTPTGAAIMKTLVDRYTVIPDIIVESTGLGAGSRKTAGRTMLPDVLRLILGKPLGQSNIIPCEDERHMADIKNRGDNYAKTLLLSTNIDDSTPEIAGYVLEKLLESEALDVWMEPIYMKKNRPSFKLCVLCSREKMDDVMEIIFTETTTLGIRIQELTRVTLPREVKKIKLPYGEIDIKIGSFNGKKVTFSPEYSSCVRLSKKTGRTLQEIYRDALFFLSKR